MLDLPAYFDRIRTDAPEAPTLESLRVLHAAHLESIPFENLDQRLGRPVAIDVDSLQEKLIRRRRGGYCFEQNALFAAVLRELGYEVDTLEARVRPIGATAPLPRTHMTLRITVDGRAWLADVGFGGDGPFLPVPLDGETFDDGLERYQVVQEDRDTAVLRGTIDGEWRDLYAFRPEPALPIDFEVAHYYTATHPRSRFRQMLTVQLSTRTARHRLRGRTYERTGESPLTRPDLGDEQAWDLIRSTFGLDVPFEDIRTALSR